MNMMEQAKKIADDIQLRSELAKQPKQWSYGELSRVIIEKQNDRIREGLPFRELILSEDLLEPLEKDLGIDDVYSKRYENVETEGNWQLFGMKLTWVTGCKELIVVR